jgi:hypothetical protein
MIFHDLQDQVLRGPAQVAIQAPDRPQLTGVLEVLPLLL